MKGTQILSALFLQIPVTVQLFKNKKFLKINDNGGFIYSLSHDTLESGGPSAVPSSPPKQMPEVSKEAEGTGRPCPVGRPCWWSCRPLPVPCRLCPNLTFSVQTSQPSYPGGNTTTPSRSCFVFLHALTT